MLLLGSLLSSCDDAFYIHQIDLDFHSQGQKIEINQMFTDAMDRDVIVEDFRFYISDIMGSNRAEDVILIDYELSSEYQFTTGGPWFGDKLFCTVGIPEKLNAQSPTQYPASHPLSSSKNMFWDMSAKYRFVILEGRMDADQDGQFETLFAYHVGLDENARFIQLQPHHVVDGAAHFKVDLSFESLLELGKEPIDATVENETHTVNKPVLATKFVNNFAHAIQ